MTITNLVDANEIENEITFFLRNSNVITQAIRGVTSDTDSGTFSSTSEHLINLTNIKNIRSIVVDSVTLTYGEDYTYDVDYDDSGTIKTKITFNSAQTGAYVITYDYGNDKIYSDFPRDDISQSAYPRISVTKTSTRSVDASLDATIQDNTHLITIQIWVDNKKDLNQYIKKVREAMKNNRSDFYYLRYIRPIGEGPEVPAPERRGKIITKTIEFESILNIEVIS